MVLCRPASKRSDNGCKICLEGESLHDSEKAQPEEWKRPRLTLRSKQTVEMIVRCFLIQTPAKFISGYEETEFLAHILLFLLQ